MGELQGTPYSTASPNLKYMCGRVALTKLDEDIFQDRPVFELLTPGGLDILTSISQAISDRFPANDSAPRHRLRTLFLWAPVMAALIFLRQLELLVKRRPTR